MITTQHPHQKKGFFFYTHDSMIFGYNHCFFLITMGGVGFPH